MLTMLDAVERHPLARRLLAGHEPEVTERVLETPALNDLRRGVADRLRQEQAEGTVRPDIDPVPIANGVVVILLALLFRWSRSARPCRHLRGRRGRRLRRRARRPAALSRRGRGDLS